MKKILLALSILFVASGCYAEDVIKEQPIAPVSETTVITVTEETVKSEIPVLREFENNVSESTTVMDIPVSNKCDSENGCNYSADTEYLLQKIDSFAPIDITKKVIIRTVDESEIEVPNDIISNDEIPQKENIVKDQPKKIEFEDKVAMTKLYCKFHSAAVLDQPHTNLTWVEKFKLRRYFKRLAKKEFKSIYYSGSVKSVARVKVVIDRNGKVVKAKIDASSYNKEFNKQIINQLKDAELPKFNISVQEIVGIYHFDNIKYMEK